MGTQQVGASPARNGGRHSESGRGEPCELLGLEEIHATGLERLGDVRGKREDRKVVPGERARADVRASPGRKLAPKREKSAAKLGRVPPRRPPATRLSIRLALGTLGRADKTRKVSSRSRRLCSESSPQTLENAADRRT
jgi:hypothetical protein